MLFAYETFGEDIFWTMIVIVAFWMFFRRSGTGWEVRKAAKGKWIVWLLGRLK